MPEQIYPFSTNEAPPLTEVGGKAKSLISTTQSGLPVPEGIALTVAFFEPWTDEIKATTQWTRLLDNPVKENCDTVKTLAQGMVLTGEQRVHLEKALAEIGDASVFAVRSSSPEEDLEGSSFAGMYETFLGTTRDQLEATIAQAYSSMLDFRVMEYKTQNNLDLENTCISVIVQKQIASDVSGVGFSLNPLNNCYDEVVINASFGLGEAIVSGIVTPDNYVVEKVTMEILEKTINDKKIALHLAADGGIEEKDNPEPKAQALSDAQILELTELIKKCEAHYNLPIDTEWAYENGKLYLLQARPITTYIPLFPEMMTEPGERKKLYMDAIVLTQGFDDALSVLGGDVWNMVLDYLKLGALPAGEDGYILNVNGRQYFQLHTFFKGMGKKAGMGIPSLYDITFKGREEETFQEYVAPRKSDLIKQGKKAQFRVMRTMLLPVIKAVFYPARGAMKMEEVSSRLMEHFKRIKNDRPFDELVDSTFETFSDVIENMAIYLSGMLAKKKVTKMMKGTAAEELVDSILMDLPSNPTSAMGHAMFALASYQEIQDTADAAEFEHKIRERSYSAEFMSAWDDYVYKYGNRGFKEIDVASMRLEEKLDEFFLQLKTMNLNDNQMTLVTERKEEALEKMRAVARKKGKLKAFDKAVDVINQTYGARELPKYLIVVMIGGLRKVALEVAEEFVTQGRLEHRDQIFDLHKEQIGQAQKDPSLQLLPLIEENLKPYKLMENVKQFPSFIDSRGKIFRNVVNAEEGDLAGMAVSNGVVKGKAKVLSSPYEKPLEPGEILVTVATEPAWTPVFTNASGVVLEVGGGLQHGAIIAREYGIPCVSGLPGVTEMVKDGDLLEVDGTNGIVRILEEA